MTNIFLIFAPSIWHELIFRLLPTRCPVCGSGSIKVKNGHLTKSFSGEYPDYYNPPHVICRRCFYDYHIWGGPEYYYLKGEHIHDSMQENNLKWR